MADSTNPIDPRGPLDPFDRVGLCKTCQHVRVVNSARGSVFYMCELAESDERFSKYPRLPVLRCTGYKQAETS